MQTLWQHTSFPIGYSIEHFRNYFTGIADWQSTDMKGVSICDPTTRSKKKEKSGGHDLADKFSTYFQDLDYETHKTLSGAPGYVTSTLSDDAGYRLKWTLRPRLLKIEPGGWTKAQPLPDTSQEDFLFWYCPVPHRRGIAKELGSKDGGLQVIPAEGKPTTYEYVYAGQAVLAYNLPHLLQPINPKVKTPYYCLYGQLQPFT